MSYPESPLTVTQLKQIFPAADGAKLGQVATELNRNPGAYGIGTRLQCAHFFAQVRQESGPDLKEAVESLEYKPAALVSLFGYYKQHPDEASDDGYERDETTHKIVRHAAQEKIANNVYANRNGNGDIASGDGWKFRGRGLIQVTGRGNYDAITKRCQKLYPGDAVDFVADPDSMAALPGSIRSAVGFWVENGLPAVANKGGTAADVDAVTHVINAKTDSYADRRQNFTLAMQALS
jgi:predicted chitinase